MCRLPRDKPGHSALVDSHILPADRVIARRGTRRTCLAVARRCVEAAARDKQSVPPPRQAPENAMPLRAGDWRAPLPHTPPIGSRCFFFFLHAWSVVLHTHHPASSPLTTARARD